MVKNNFNRVSSIYDSLVDLVFRDKLWNAQRYHLHRICAKDTVLILGGGSGKVLEWLPECNAVYLEKAEQMVSRAKRKGQAEFIIVDFLEWNDNRKFDWVICPFFLDCFDQSELYQCIGLIKNYLKSDGKLIVTDFKENGFWSNLLISLMLLFFRLMANLSAKELYDLRKEILNSGFKPVDEADFLNGLVFSDLYVKN